MIVQQQQEGHWVARGNGPTRYIISEGTSRESAVRGWEHMATVQYGDQYAREQVATHFSMMSEGRREKKLADARMYADDIRSKL